MTENQLSGIVFESALKVHRNLGLGLLENSYAECMFYELKISVIDRKTEALTISL